MQTIVDCGSGIPCIDTIFGPTQSNAYWSSTAGPLIRGSYPLAWLVNFSNGNLSADAKYYDYYVRAVRGGL